MSFANLGLAEPLLRAVREQGYDTPTPIQAQAIPAVLAGHDVMGGAQTGTGKTAGFTLPLLQRLWEKPRALASPGRRPIRALVLTPTRELAAQVEQSVRAYGRHLPLRSMVMFGGVGMQPQIDALRSGVDIVVATPGRLLDHAGQGTLNLGQVEILVLDEADRMLDMGFIHDIRKVLALLPQRKQSLLFSATFSDEIKALADRLLDAPKLIEVARRNATAELVDQKVHPVGRERKKELLAHLIRQGDWHQVLVFTRMKHGANRLAEYLNREGIGALAIHGNKSQGARTRALDEFKRGDLPVLVATDIAARGIDIDQLPHVVNFELPNVPEDYVHRIGRTGRAGAAGQAISLVCLDEEGFLADIERLIGRRLTREPVTGFEAPPGERAEPIVLGRMTIGVGAPRRGARPGEPRRGAEVRHPSARPGAAPASSTRQGDAPAGQRAAAPRHPHHAHARQVGAGHHPTAAAPQRQPGNRRDARPRLTSPKR